MVETIVNCQHFGTCGGCDYTNEQYLESLKVKQEYVKSKFQFYEVENILEIIPSVKLEYHRNKMEFAVGGQVGNVLIGLRQKGKFNKIVDLKCCKTFHPKTVEILTIIKEWMQENNLEPYDIIKHKGKIRYVAMRHSKTFDELMLNIVITGSKYQFEYLEHKLFQSLVQKISLFKIVSFYICINNKLSDNALTDEVFKIYGTDFIKEKVNNIIYKIYPQTFFQTNTLTCELMYNLISSEIDGGNVLDIYCGSGGISLQVSSRAQKVIGIDSLKENILVANQNKELNNISNVEFVCENAETFVTKLLKSKFYTELSTIIIDPPRAGLSKRVCNTISELGVNKIIYVSCNIESLTQDLKLLTRFYKIKKVVPIDMFPFTKHLETIVLLEHK